MNEAGSTALSLSRLGLLAFVWLAYFAIHSSLASLTVKYWIADRCPRCMAGYRLLFNTLALVLLIPPLWLSHAWHGDPLWSWNGIWAWLANGLALMALAGFFWSLRYYDGAEFLGLRQWREQAQGVEDQEHFQISPLHRFVRHPWYFLGLVLVWTRDMDPAFLVTALAVTAYFVVGSRLEERKLLSYYGEVYRRYRASVPGLWPLPWRYLDRRSAQALVASARQGLAVDPEKGP